MRAARRSSSDVAINTFAPIHKKPTLVCLDFKQLTARRYFPRHPAGFLRDDANLPPAEDQQSSLRWEIEQFRQTGKTA